MHTYSKLSCDRPPPPSLSLFDCVAHHHHHTAEEVEELRKVFKAIDTNNNGTIDMHEIGQGLRLLVRTCLWAGFVLQLRLQLRYISEGHQKAVLNFCTFFSHDHRNERNLLFVVRLGTFFNNRGSPLWWCRCRVLYFLHISRIHVFNLFYLPPSK